MAFIVFFHLILCRIHSKIQNARDQNRHFKRSRLLHICLKFTLITTQCNLVSIQCKDFPNHFKTFLFYLFIYLMAGTHVKS